MRKLALAAVAAAALILLAACSAPLTSKDVHLQVKSTSTADLLPGDPFTLNVSGKLAQKRADKVRVLVQSSPDGKTWTIDSKHTKVGTSLGFDQSIKLAKAGDTKYRVQVQTIGDKPKVLATSTPVDVTVYDLPAMVKTLFYNMTQAYNQSTQAGFAFDAANDYPGIFDTAGTAWTTAANQAASDQFRQAIVPDVSTLSPDPKWVLSSAGKCYAAQTSPSPGRTFIVTAQVTNSAGSFSLAPTQSQLHVTLHDGKVYYYFSDCDYG